MRRPETGNPFEEYAPTYRFELRSTAAPEAVSIVLEWLPPATCGFDFTGSILKRTWVTSRWFAKNIRTGTARPLSIVLRIGVPVVAKRLLNNL